MCDKKKMLDISVIIPTYNSDGTIEKTLNSVCNQSTLPREVIIVDDCSLSTKYLTDIIRSLSSIINIHLISLSENKGTAYARNVGVKMATSEYLAFLDSDDVWHPLKLETQYFFMINTGAHISGHEYIQNLTYTEMKPRLSPKRKVIRKSSFVFGNPFFTPTVMIKNNMVLFNPNYRVVDDYCCWIENLHKGPAFIIQSQLAGGFKAAIGAGGLTGSIGRMHFAYKTVLRDLYQKNEIGKIFYIMALIVEYFKYPLRRLKCNLNS